MIKDGISCEKNVKSILMIGQSNMAGRGNVEDVEPIMNELCYMLRMGRWQKMREPINPDRSLYGKFRSGISLAASFADEYAKKFNVSVGLIPCADGGTCISQWMPGEILFDHAVFQTELAQRTSELGAIIWHQGESDCHTEEDVWAYKEKFITMMTELRSRICAEKVPLIISELSENIASKYEVADRPRKLNKILHEIADEIPLCRVVSSKGLELKEDGLHFNSTSCREFGKRYFEEFLKLM